MVKPIYSPAQIDAIIAAFPSGLPDGPLTIYSPNQNGNEEHPREVDRRSYLEEKLEDVGRWYLGRAYLQGKPKPSDNVRLFQAIETAAGTLLKALRLPEDGAPDDIPPEIRHPLNSQAEAEGKAVGGYPHYGITTGEAGTDYHGVDQVRDNIEGIKQIHEWANRARLHQKRLVADKSGERVADKALNDLYGSLIGIWSDVFERLPKTSTGGPESKNRGKASGPTIRYMQACISPLGLDKTNDSIRSKIRELFPRMVG